MRDVIVMDGNDMHRQLFLIQKNIYFYFVKNKRIYFILYIYFIKYLEKEKVRRRKNRNQIFVESLNISSEISNTYSRLSSDSLNMEL